MCKKMHEIFSISLPFIQNREFYRFSFMTVVYLARALTYNKMLFYNHPCFYLVSLTTRCLPRAPIIQFLSFTIYNTKRCTVEKYVLLIEESPLKLIFIKTEGENSPTHASKIKEENKLRATP